MICISYVELEAEAEPQVLDALCICVCILHVQCTSIVHALYIRCASGPRATLRCAALRRASAVQCTESSSTQRLLAVSRCHCACVLRLPLELATNPSCRVRVVLHSTSEVLCSLLCSAHIRLTRHGTACLLWLWLWLRGEETRAVEWSVVARPERQVAVNGDRWRSPAASCNSPLSAVLYSAYD